MLHSPHWLAARWENTLIHTNFTQRTWQMQKLFQKCYKLQHCEIMFQADGRPCLQALAVSVMAATALSATSCCGNFRRRPFRQPSPPTLPWQHPPVLQLLRRLLPPPAPCSPPNAARIRPCHSAIALPARLSGSPRSTWRLTAPHTEPRWAASLSWAVERSVWADASLRICRPLTPIHQVCLGLDEISAVCSSCMHRAYQRCSAPHLSLRGSRMPHVCH